MQTRGRGRGGKLWVSPRGGLWFSIVVRPNIPAPKITLLQFFASNAVRRGLEQETGLRPRVKWPNDLVSDSCKLGGILVEAKTIGDKVSFAIIGIGVNLNIALGLLPEGATSVFLASGTRYDAGKVLRSILETLRSTYNDLQNPSRMLDEWWQNCIHHSKRVQVDGPSGIIRGFNRGVDLQGRLIVETENQRLERVVEGTLRVLDD